eukprot:4144777-Prymnesium_polylepis.1
MSGQAQARAATTLTLRLERVGNRPISSGHRATSSMPSESRAWPPLCTCRIGVRGARHCLGKRR